MCRLFICAIYMGEKAPKILIFIHPSSSCRKQSFLCTIKNQYETGIINLLANPPPPGPGWQRASLHVWAKNRIRRNRIRLCLFLYKKSYFLRFEEKREFSGDLKGKNLRKIVTTWWNCSAWYSKWALAHKYPPKKTVCHNTKIKPEDSFSLSSIYWGETVTEKKGNLSRDWRWHTKACTLGHHSIYKFFFTRLQGKQSDKTMQNNMPTLFPNRPVGLPCSKEICQKYIFAGIKCRGLAQ